MQTMLTMAAIGAAGVIAQHAGGGDPRDDAPAGAVGAVALFLLVGLALAIVFLVAMYVMIRSVRRYRALAAQRPDRTSYVDVWSMHKAPDFDVLEEDDDDPWGLKPRGDGA